MWINIPDNNENYEDWVGKVESPVKVGDAWTFEVIRRCRATETGNLSPFEENNAVSGLLDHQKNCTIFNHFITDVDHGMTDHEISSSRTKIRGKFQVLIKNVALKSEGEKIFKSVGFQSKSLMLWHGRHYHTSYSKNGKLASRRKWKRKERFVIEEIGTISWFVGALSRQNSQYSRSETSSYIEINFRNLKCLKEILEICLDLEKLIGFVVGQRPIYPVFNFKTKHFLNNNGKRKYLSGEIHVSEFRYEDKEKWNLFDTIHREAMGGILFEDICKNFVINRQEIIKNISVVEYCWKFVNNTSEKFSVSMPVLEEIIRSQFINGEEKIYKSAESEFFSWVEKSESEAVKEFSKKHVRLTAKKEPSLALLLERAIKHLNTKGFCLNENLSKRIQSRRGRHFHSYHDLRDSKEIHEFHEESMAIIFIIMMLNLEKIGIDIELLNNNRFLKEDFWYFFCSRL